MTDDYDPLTGEPVDGARDMPEPEKKEKKIEDFDPVTGDPIPPGERPAEDGEPPAESYDLVTGAPLSPAPGNGGGKGGSEDGDDGKDRGEILSALRGMVSFFTIIRLPVGQREFDAMERNFWLAPVVGALVGFVAFAVCILLGAAGFGYLEQGAFALASAYLFSKFLHFDGLTDFGDGMVCSSGSRDKHVRALKDTLVGAGGVGVAIVTVLLTVILYYRAGASLPFAVELGRSYLAVNVAFLAFACEVLVKNAQVAAAAYGEPGNGMASRQVGCTDSNSLIRSTAVTAVLLVLIGFLFAVFCTNVYGYGFAVGSFAILFVAAISASIIAGWAMARIANRNFGFVNGDILGATNEISRAVVLLVVAVLFGVFY